MINKAENSLDKRLVNDVSDLKRDVRELKTKQPIGADSLAISEQPGAGLALTAGPLTVAPGNAVFIFSKLQPVSRKQTLSNFVNTLYIDALDASHAYPLGSSLSAGTAATTFFTAWLDSLQMRTFIPFGSFIQYMAVYNKDTVSHTYYVEVRAFTPQSAGTFV